MAYAWTKTISVGAVIKEELLTEIGTVSDYIVANHCPANCTANKTTNNYAVNSHNSSVYSSDRSGYCSYNRGLISSLPGGLQPGYIIFQQCTGPTPTYTCSKGCGSDGINPATGLPHMSHVGVVIRVDWNDGSGSQLAVFQSVAAKSSPLALVNPSLKALLPNDGDNNIDNAGPNDGGPNITGFTNHWKYYGIPVPLK